MADTYFSKVVSTGPRSRVEFILIGGRILGVRFFGILSNSFYSRFKMERSQFLNDVGLVNTYFLEYRDFAGVHSFWGSCYRFLKDDIHSCSHNLETYNSLAYYIQNLPAAIRFLYRIFIHSRNGAFHSEYCSSHRDLLLRSINLLYERGVYSFAEKTRVANKEWFYENPLYRESMQMLTDELVYCECRGNLSRMEEAQRRLVWEQLLESQPSLRKGFTVIMGLKEHEFPQEDLDNILSSAWLDMLHKAKCQKFIVITSLDSNAVAVNQLLTLNPLSHRVERRFTNTLNSLFPKDVRHWGRQSQEGFDGSLKDLEKLENYLLSLDVTKSRRNQLISSETLSEKDPLRPVYQSVNLFFSKVRDDYLYIYRDWRKKSAQVKTAQLTGGIYEILYKNRYNSLTLEQAIEEITELFNQILSNGRASCFHPSLGSYRCSRSDGKGRTSLSGTIIPASVVACLEEKAVKSIQQNEWVMAFTPRERLMIGPFLQSFLRSQGINRFHYRIIHLENQQEGHMVLVDFQDEASTEQELISPVMDKMSELLYRHFKPQEVKTQQIPVPVSIEEALKEYEGDEDFYKEVLGNFLSGLPSEWSVLEQAVREVQWESIRQEAHKIKGGAANLYARKMQSSARQLEEMAVLEDRDGCNVAFDRLKERAEELQVWFDNQWA